VTVETEVLSAAKKSLDGLATRVEVTLAEGRVPVPSEKSGVATAGEKAVPWVVLRERGSMACRVEKECWGLAHRVLVPLEEGC